MAQGRRRRGAAGRRRRPPARHRWRGVHRQRLRPGRPGATRRDADHRPRQADLRRQPRRTSRRSRPTRSRRAATGSSQGDIADPGIVGPLVAEADAVLNFAAESHVDRSILDPEAFLRTGVIGVHVLLEAVRAASAERRRSGPAARPLPPGLHRRGLRRRPGGPFAGRRPARARARPTPRRRPPGSCSSAATSSTHGVDAVVTRGSNTYGPYHHPEKLIPLFVTNAIDDQPLPLYGDGLQERDWLYVSDHAGAIDHVLRHGDDRRDLQPAGFGRDDEPGGRRRRSSSTSASHGRSSEACPTGPATTGATPWTGPSSRHSAGGTGPRSPRGSPRRSTGSGPTSRGGGPRRAGDWDAYYQRQYGDRLAASTEA